MSRADRPASVGEVEAAAGGLAVLPVDGLVPYREGLEWQRAVARRRIDGELDRDLLVLLEHEPVLTLGRNAGEDHLAVGEDRLRAEAVERVEVERGGDVTYHGPGQLVGYPILDLRDYRQDLHWYLRTVEAALLDGLQALGLEAFRAEGFTGIWVGDPGSSLADRTLPEDEARRRIPDGAIRKVASIGVHVSRWVTWHGFALNVTPEPLEKFDLVVPCGIRGVRMTSLRSEGVEVDLSDARRAMVQAFGDAFGVEATAQPSEPWDKLRRRGDPVEADGDAAGGARKHAPPRAAPTSAR